MSRRSLRFLAVATTVLALLMPATAGATWSSQPTPLDSDNIHAAQIEAVYFLDQNTGWAVGYGAGMLHTVNGGGMWSLQTVPVTNPTFDYNHAVRFISATQGWVGSDDGVFYSANGGDTWDLAITPANVTVVSLAFPTASTGWAVNSFGAGELLKSADGGHSWSSVEVTAAATHPTIADFRCVTFPSASQGWVCGSAGAIYHTGDGGATWARQSTDTTQTLRSIDFVDALHGWAVGDYDPVHGRSTVLSTADGGVHWGVQTSPVAAHFLSVDFRDATHGWAVGMYGRCIWTADGGATWVADPLPASVNAVSVAVPPTGPAFVAAEAFHVYRHVDAPTPKSVTLSRTPAKSSATYTRKRGVAKIALACKLTSQGSAVGSGVVYLQASANGATGWRSLYRLVTSAKGVAAKTITVKKKSTTFYRWYAPSTATRLVGYSTRFNAIVK